MAVVKAEAYGHGAAVTAAFEDAVQACGGHAGGVAQGR